MAIAAGLELGQTVQHHLPLEFQLRRIGQVFQFKAPGDSGDRVFRRHPGGAGLLQAVNLGRQVAFVDRRYLSHNHFSWQRPRHKANFMFKIANPLAFHP